jgi:hypothetical protein
VVLPQITQLLESLNQPLPFYTRWIIASSEFVRAWWWALAGGAALLVFAFRTAIRTERGRIRYDRVLLRLPVIGRLVRLLAITRFSRTLSTLLAGGLPITRALHTAGEVAANTVIAEAIEAARLVCVYSSTAGLEALIAGCPVVAWGPSCYRELCAKPGEIAEAEHPGVEAVEGLLERIAYTQWSLDELATGEPFRFVLEQMGVECPAAA